MARDRQRAKQRQAERRAARLAGREGDGQARDAAAVDEVFRFVGRNRVEAELGRGRPAARTWAAPTRWSSTPSRRCLTSDGEEARGRRGLL